MSEDKEIRRVTDPEEQEMETYRYWQSRPIGERLIAVCEVSQAAYEFAQAFKGGRAHADQKFQGPAQSTERKFS